MNDKVPELTEKGFDDFVKGGLVLVDFFADWCMPCMMMVPIVEELSEIFKDKIKFGKVNVEDSQNLAQRFEVRSIPHFVLFKEGKVIDNFNGSISQEDFEEKLNGHLK